MTKKITYTDEPFGEIEVVPDFLPSSVELVVQEEDVGVNIDLGKNVVEELKKDVSQN